MVEAVVLTVFSSVKNVTSVMSDGNYADSVRLTWLLGCTVTNMTKDVALVSESTCYDSVYATVCVA